MDEVTVVQDPGELDAAAWRRWSGANPFADPDFLVCLHQGGCASRETGWQPLYLALRRQGDLAGIMPLYLKNHSRGEYVFDQGWAEAFARHGLSYYPKLVSAVPFTPVAGPRLLAGTHADRLQLARAAIALARQLEVSSLHVLFPDADSLAALREAGCLVREGVQFHWRNAGYADFDAFLAGMSHDKRKKIRQDSRKVERAGIAFRHLRGHAIDRSMLDFFYHCYAATYASHWGTPYLDPDFFHALHARQPESLLLIVAQRGDDPLACALNVIGGPAEASVAYGRYWGCQTFVPGLHFETCYLQAIRYCIAHGIVRFEGGAQGEHKLARGLLPAPTWSAHWIADRRFAGAIEDFLQRETAGVDAYRDALQAHSPFKRET